MKNKNLFPQFLFSLTICAIGIGILLGIFLPWILSACLDIGRGAYGESMNFKTLLTLLYITYFPFMVIWAAVFKLCRNLAKDIPFCKNSILNLKIIGICAFFDCLVFICGMFLFSYAGIVFFIIATAALMISVISAIIRELVIRGIELREEVELTV
ncbi:MAG: DUF2975 domain-containing protein [Eubacteriales bacterium]